VQTKDITDRATETASYKALPLGNNFYLWTVYDSLSATPPTSLIPLPFIYNGRGMHIFFPTVIDAIDSEGYIASIFRAIFLILVTLFISYSFQKC
jgi:hypothetical protein